VVSTSTKPATDSAYSWVRLAYTLLISGLSSVGMWSVVVLMPAFESDFQLTRTEASYPYMLVMTGFVIGGVLFGRCADRFGVTRVLMASTALTSAGFAISAWVGSFPFFLGSLLMVGAGTAAGFAPLLADISHWFSRRRGIAISIAASGSYLSGVLWPVLISSVLTHGTWRDAHLIIAAIVLVTVIPLSLLLRCPVPEAVLAEADLVSSAKMAQVGLSPRLLSGLLAVAGVGCCVAMAMPQVHLVALCVDRGLGVGLGSEILSMTLVAGILSRLVAGYFSDLLGGLPTLLLGSALQTLALALYLPSDGLTSLYVVSLIFGLSQGGILPAYSMIIREYLPSRDAGGAVSFVMAATVVGMALGGWLSGWIYENTGSYDMAFINGIAWNFLNIFVIVAIFLCSVRNGSLRSSAHPT
jgi:MFS family permease